MAFKIHFLITIILIVTLVNCEEVNFSDAVIDSTGQSIYCGFGPSRRECPLGSYCNIAPNDAYAYCARPKKVLPADAIIDAGSNAIECGVGGYCGTEGWICKSDQAFPNGYCAHRAVGN